MNKGEIFFGKNNRIGRHPIVYLSGIDDYTFNGLMLTHSSGYGNIKLRAECFEWSEDTFDTESTHMVNKKLIKKAEWQPFIKVGKLSKQGIEFVESKVANMKAEFFD